MRQTLERIVIDQNNDPARGLLHKATSLRNFELLRLAASDDLEPFIEHFWIVSWTLDEPYTQENLPHPSQHLVIDPIGGTGIFGLQRAKFTYRLEGSGAVLGTKFRPGMFRGFFGRPVHEITDKSVPVSSVFGVDDAFLNEEFGQMNDPAGMADRIEAMLRTGMPEQDPRAEEAQRLVAEVSRSPDLFTVAALARLAGVTPRSLQRLFEDYVGVGPKWVIDRYRMIEAVEALNRNEETSLTMLAHALGYFDQAHFSKAFVALTGKTPSSYRRAG